MIHKIPSPLRPAPLGRRLESQRVYLLDDSRMARAAMRRLILAAGGFDIVGEGGEVEFALQDAPGRTPDLIVFDPFLDGDDGLHGLLRLGLHMPSSSIVVATSDEERAMSELQIGDNVRALVSKEGEPAEFVRALRAAGDGAWFVCPRLAGRFRRPFHER